MVYAVEAGTPYASAMGIIDHTVQAYFVLVVVGLAAEVIGVYRNFRQAHARVLQSGNATAAVFINRPAGGGNVTLRVTP